MPKDPSALSRKNHDILETGLYLLAEKLEFTISYWWQIERVQLGAVMPMARSPELWHIYLRMGLLNFSRKVSSILDWPGELQSDMTIHHEGERVMCNVQPSSTLSHVMVHFGVRPDVDSEDPIAMHERTLTNRGINMDRDLATLAAENRMVEIEVEI